MAEESEETDLLKAFLGQAEAQEASTGGTHVRRYRNPVTGEVGPAFVLPPKANEAEWDAKCARTMAEQDARRVPLAPIDPSAVATAGGIPIADYHKASGNKDKAEPARSSTSIRFVR